MNKEKLLDENSKHALQSDNIIAITNRHLCSRPFMEQLERICKLHPHAIVLREKDMPEAEYLSLARDVIALCKKYDVQCMLHSFINVAMELEHPYIHLPLPILEAYVQKNVSCNISTGMSKSTDNYQQFFKVIGTSVHSVEDAIKAEQLGATYMTAGHIFATDCKKGLPPRGLDFLKNVCDAVEIPVYAIGGINIASNDDSTASDSPSTYDAVPDISVPRLADVMWSRRRMYYVGDDEGIIYRLYHSFYFSSKISCGSQHNAFDSLTTYSTCALFISFLRCSYC